MNELEEALAVVAALVFKHDARLMAHHETIVELMLKASPGLTAEACDKILAERTEKWHQMMLEKIEDLSPALAILMGRRKPGDLPPV